MPSEELARRMRPVPVHGIHSTQRSKEDAYGRIRMLLSERRLVLPDDPDLLRQLHGLRCTTTPGGGVTIEATSAVVHDDLADALSLAVAVLPPGRPTPAWTDPPDDLTAVHTPSGLLVPYEARPTRNTLHPDRRTRSY